MCLSNLNRIQAFFFFPLGWPDCIPHLHYVSIRLMNINILFMSQIISPLPHVVLQNQSFCGFGKPSSNYAGLIKENIYRKIVFKYCLTYYCQNGTKNHSFCCQVHSSSLIRVCFTIFVKNMNTYKKTDGYLTTYV